MSRIHQIFTRKKKHGNWSVGHRYHNADNHQLHRTDIFLTGIHQVATHARHKHVIANKGQSHFNRNFQRSSNPQVHITTLVHQYQHSCSLTTAANITTLYWEWNSGWHGHKAKHHKQACVDCCDLAPQPWWMHNGTDTEQSRRLYCQKYN